MRDETKCLHAGYTPKNGEPRVLPIVQSTTYVYDSAAEVAAIFDDPTKGLCYSRFGNPTVMAVEEKIAALEGGVGAMCTTSGQAATLLSILNICQAGDSTGRPFPLQWKRIVRFVGLRQIPQRQRLHRLRQQLLGQKPNLAAPAHGRVLRCL